MTIRTKHTTNVDYMCNVMKPCQVQIEILFEGSLKFGVSIDLALTEKTKSAGKTIYILFVAANDADKTLFQWKNNNNNNNNENDKPDGLAPSAKVFVAETISQDENGADPEKVRKISIAAAEFITIENQENKGKDAGWYQVGGSC